MALSAFRFLFLLFTIVTQVIAAPTENVVEKRQLVTSLLNSLLGPEPPTQDDWYQPAPGYESKSPGDILKIRQIPIPAVFTALTPTVTESVWQIQFRSTDSQNNPIAAVTTLFKPITGDGTKLFSHSIAYDASDVDCSPSYQLRQLTNPTPEVAVIVLGLYNGWYVQSPDHESYEAAFTDGIVAAHVTLDSLRAVTHSGQWTGLKNTARIGMNGGSGGAIGIEFGLEIQKSYAPDVQIAGVTLGSLTPNIEHVYNTINGGAFAGLAPAAITGLAKTNPDFANYINTNLIAKTASTFKKADNQCLTDNQAMFAKQNISLYFTDPGFLSASVPQSTIEKVGIMGKHGIPGVPVYVYKGFGDEISSVDDTDALVEQWCNGGIPSVVYVRNILTGHETESILGIVGAFEYILERMNGVPPIDGCVYVNSTKTTITNADQTALGNIGPLVVSILNNALKSITSILI